MTLISLIWKFHLNSYNHIKVNFFNIIKMILILINKHIYIYDLVLFYSYFKNIYIYILLLLLLLSLLFYNPIIWSFSHFI